MKAKELGQKIQDSIDGVLDLLQPIENRWLTLGVAVFAVLITKAVGAQGLSNLIAMIYIMFWVTHNRSGS